MVVRTLSLSGGNVGYGIEGNTYDILGTFRRPGHCVPLRPSVRRLRGWIDSQCIKISRALYG